MMPEPIITTATFVSILGGTAFDRLVDYLQGYTAMADTILNKISKAKIESALKHIHNANLCTSDSTIQQQHFAQSVFQFEEAIAQLNQISKKDGLHSDILLARFGLSLSYLYLKEEHCLNHELKLLGKSIIEFDAYVLKWITETNELIYDTGPLRSIYTRLAKTGLPLLRSVVGTQTEKLSAWIRYNKEKRNQLLEDRQDLDMAMTSFYGYFGYCQDSYHSEETFKIARTMENFIKAHEQLKSKKLL